MEIIISNRQTYLCSCAKKPSWEKNCRLKWDLSTWAVRLCCTVLYHQSLMIIWELDKFKIYFVSLTEWMTTKTLLYISTLYEISWSEEFEMCNDYYNVIHFFNFMWHLKDHTWTQGHFPIKAKWECFSLSKDIWYEICSL